MIRPLSQAQLQNISNPHAGPLNQLSNTFARIGQENRQDAQIKAQTERQGRVDEQNTQAFDLSMVTKSAPLIASVMSEAAKLNQEQRLPFIQNALTGVPSIAAQFDENDTSDEAIGGIIGAMSNMVGISSDQPSTVQEWEYFNSLPPEDQKRFLHMKRQGIDIKKIGGVETLVDKNAADGGLRPLSTVDKEKSAQAEIKSAVEKSVGEVKGEQQRFNDLRSSASGRNNSIKKASKFLKLFQNRNMKSGAGRAAASYVPGIYSDQGKLDEEFNAFAEVAARQTLKASGELRPTDADVEGMKRAMFGIGRDESVNMILLQDYLDQQGADEAEYQGLKQDKSASKPPLPEGVTELDILETMRANNMTRQQVMEQLNAR